jgi:hypothetical protein
VPRKLIALLRDPHPAIRQAARLALVRVSAGYDFGPFYPNNEAQQLEAIAKWNEWRDWREAMADDADVDRSEVIAKLNGPAAQERLAATILVGQCRFPLGSQLIGLLEDAEPGIRLEARLALVELALGADFGPELTATADERAEAIRKWKAWWTNQKEAVAQEELWLSEVPKEQQAANATFRVWTDRTGRQKLEAVLVDVGNGWVTLGTRARSALRLPINNLSEADRLWIREELKRRRNRGK